MHRVKPLVKALKHSKLYLLKFKINLLQKMRQFTTTKIQGGSPETQLSISMCCLVDEYNQPKIKGMQWGSMVVKLGEKNNQTTDPKNVCLRLH